MTHQNIIGSVKTKPYILLSKKIDGKNHLLFFNSERAGLSCSLALNGNSEFFIKTLSFAKLSSLCSLALEPKKVSHPCPQKKIDGKNHLLFLIRRGWDCLARSHKTAIPSFSSRLCLSQNYPASARSRSNPKRFLIPALKKK